MPVFLRAQERSLVSEPRGQSRSEKTGASRHAGWTYNRTGVYQASK